MTEDSNLEETPLVDTMESDLAQSVDNIDRILQNIDEESEESGFVIRRNLSRESESSGDYASMSVSKCKRLQVESTGLVTPVDSTRPVKDWAVSTEDHLNRQSGVTISSTSWYKNVNAHQVANNLEKSYGTCRSTSCIPSAQKDAITSVSSIESMLSQSPIPVVANKRLYEEKRESADSETSSATEEIFADSTEKKKKLKSTLIKRARSVAVFSLKLKERRAKIESKDVEKSKEKISPRNENVIVGGELSCVPIEMLISMDDVNLKTQGTKKSSGVGLQRATTPTTLSLPKH